MVGPEVGFKQSSVNFVPLSGFSGENMLERKEPKLSWWTGPTLVEALDQLPPPPRPSSTAPLRLCQTVVKSLQMRDAPARSARAGDHLDSVLVPVEPQFASIGGVQILVFETEVPLMRGAQLMCYLHTETLTATLVRLEKLIVKGETQDRRPKCLVKGNNAIVWLQLNEKVCVEPKSQSSAMTPLSRFVLRDRGRTVGAGVVLAVQ
eukprot:g24172.t1